MKINRKELQRLYQSCITRRTGPSRENCPSPEELLEALRSLSSPQKRNQVVSHLAHCGHCAREFQFILQTLRYERELNQKLSETLSPRRKIFTFFSSWSRFSWKNASLVGAALLLIMISGFLLFQNFKTQEYRGTSRPSIHLIHPIDQTLSSPISFRWNPLKKADYYILEIFDETLYPFWKSQKIRTNRLILPLGPAKKLEENKVYYWMVTAYLPDGERVESLMEEFAVKR